ncbi:MAG: nucleotidyltransferase family protein [Planctomycetaceae bacterium]
MNSETALCLLSERLPDYRQRFDVRELAIFGSLARDEWRADSDVDVLVEFEHRPTFDGYMDLKLELEELFGRRVDLVIASDLRPAFRPQVEREALHVP